MPMMTTTTSASAVAMPMAPQAVVPPAGAEDEEPWQHTRVVKTLWPPQAGTVKLRRLYGAALVCVRYRHDSSGSHRYTTVEIVVDHAPVKIHPTRRFAEVTLRDEEHEMRATIQALGARWHKGRKVWLLDRRVAKRLGLDGAARKNRK